MRGLSLGSEGLCVLVSPGCFGRVAEWQTRWLQVPVSFGTWGFKSPFAHSERKPRTLRSSRLCAFRGGFSAPAGKPAASASVLPPRMVRCARCGSPGRRSSPPPEPLCSVPASTTSVMWGSEGHWAGCRRRSGNTGLRGRTGLVRPVHRRPRAMVLVAAHRDGNLTRMRKSSSSISCGTLWSTGVHRLPRVL